MSISRREVKAPASRRGFTGIVAACVLAFWVAAGPASAAIPARLREGLAASSVKVRLIAVAAVARTKDAEAAALLRPLLADESPVVRAAVVDSLAALVDVAAYAVIAGLQKDPDAAVRTAAGKALKVLDNASVRVDIGDVADLSGRNYPGVTERLRDRFRLAVESDLKQGVVVGTTAVDKGYGAILKIRTVTTGMSDGNGMLEVKCDMTLVEMPGKILRLTASASAAAGVEGKLPAAMEPELANDAIDACAPSLARDFADYVEQHRKR